MQARRLIRDAWKNEIIYMTLQKHGILTINDLPVGSILAEVNLIGCYSIGRVDDFQKEAELPWVDRFIWGNEYHFGWYEEGRCAWELADIELIEPIPAKGQLGLWNYQV